MKKYDHEFGSGSRANLEGVRPELVEVAELAITLCPYDGTVISGGGLRTVRQAQDNVARGTGILNSLHRKQADGYGHAVDLIALTPGKGVDWNNLPAFKAMAKAVKDAAAILQVPIRQGCDWDMDGHWGESGEWDWPHFENPKPHHMARAVELMNRHREELKLDVDDEIDAHLAAIESELDQIRSLMSRRRDAREADSNAERS